MPGRSKRFLRAVFIPEEPFCPYYFLIDDAGVECRVKSSARMAFDEVAAAELKALLGEDSVRIVN